MEVIVKIPEYRARTRNRTATQHWRRYKDDRDEMTALVRAYSKRMREPVAYQATVHIIAQFKDGRSIDTSNLDDKIIVDALMHAGILANDASKDNPRVIKDVFSNMGENSLTIIVRPYRADEITS